MTEMSQKICVTEDDFYLRRDLARLLTDAGYQVYAASSSAEAMPYILNESCDLYIFDVWLPDGDGFELIRSLRKRSSKPAIFLTVCDDEESVMKGLDLGADDYITKPYRKGELLSRVMANLRRNSPGMPDEILTVGELRFNTKTGIVSLRGEELKLAPAEYQLLQLLMRNAGLLLTRDKLLDLLSGTGPADVVDENVLRVRINRLRSQIGSQYIETIRGLGYRFRNGMDRREH